MAAPVAAGGNDPDMALSAGSPAPHELTLDSVFQGGTMPADSAGPGMLQALQFGGA